MRNAAYAIQQLAARKVARKPRVKKCSVARAPGEALQKLAPAPAALRPARALTPGLTLLSATGEVPYRPVTGPMTLAQARGALAGTSSLGATSSGVPQLGSMTSVAGLVLAAAEAATATVASTDLQAGASRQPEDTRTRDMLILKSSGSAGATPSSSLRSGVSPLTGLPVVPVFDSDAAGGAPALQAVNSLSKAGAVVACGIMDVSRQALHGRPVPRRFAVVLVKHVYVPTSIHPHQVLFPIEPPGSTDGMLMNGTLNNYAAWERARVSLAI